MFCHTLYNKYDFLDSGSYIMDGIISLHDHILYYELIILVLVLWMLIAILYNRNSFVLKDLNKGSLIEIVWTLLPGVILVLIALPSFRLLYLMEDFIDTKLTIKVIGNQWYWSYNYKDIVFDSYPLQDLYPGTLRLLDTDTFLNIPSNTPIRILVTASDVIHSWSLPSLGIKIDAIPGRLNQTGIEIYRPGVYYGSCYELCGVGHAYMPIVLRVI